MTLDPMQIADVALLLMLLVVTVGVARMNDLFAAAMLTGAYSLMSAAWMLAQDAPDVAFTEGAAGAGISTVLILGATLLTARQAAATPARRRWPALLVVIAAGLALAWALPDLAPYGSAATPANTHVGLEYLERAYVDMHIPNVVTAILASYRGFDTLGEVVVIVTAGIAVAMLLGPLTGRAGQTTDMRP